HDLIPLADQQDRPMPRSSIMAPSRPIPEVGNRRRQFCPSAIISHPASRQEMRFSPNRRAMKASRRGNRNEGETKMTDATTRLYVPALGGIYTAIQEFAEPILRIALGGILIPHGCQKLFGLFGGMGFARNAELFDKLGYSPGVFWGTLVGCTE